MGPVAQAMEAPELGQGDLDIQDAWEVPYRKPCLGSLVVAMSGRD